MNFKKYHVSRNLFDGTMEVGTITNNGNPNTSTTRIRTVDFMELEAGTYTLNATANSSLETYVFIYDLNSTFIERIPTLWVSVPYTFTIANKSKVKFLLAFAPASATATAIVTSDVSNIMLNTGSTALPYEPYSSEVWHDIPHYIHNTSTDTITTLPAVLYPNAATATVSLKGNMEQSGTPTPTNPIQPQECGDLETEGAKAGQYKIPILSNSTTTPVYLGEVQSTRRIKKLVLTGEENWRYSTSSQVHWIENVPNDYDNTLISRITTVCTHYKCIQNNTGFTGMVNGDLRLYAKETSPIAHELYIKDETYTSAADFKTYLAQQYAAGTPVTVWYVLATPETGIVNEPLRKIGDYADEVSGISIPTIAGANTIDVDTTLKPSEVSINYHGWHPVSAVHERENGAWD